MSVAAAVLPAQDHGAIAAGRLVDGLGVTARVLVVAAHPDDEDSRLIAFLQQGRSVEVGYLSLTRGDGGQNLIGPELGEALGVIRTEELLAARRVDGAHQYFTRAYDFGFSKSAAEAFAHWPREEILRDAVTVVRAFRPHVIVSVFSGTPRDGHGQHQVAGIIAREAWDLAGDTVRFPPSATAGFRGWTPLKFYRSANFRGEPTWRYNVGEFDFLLGRSYAEIMAASRSQHRSQGFGSLERRGVVLGALTREASRVDVPAVAAGESGPFHGIDTTWQRLRPQLRAASARAALDSVIAAVDEARRTLDLRRPWTAAAPLARVIDGLRSLTLAEPRATPDVERTVAIGQSRAERALAEAAGLLVEAVTTRDVLAESDRSAADSVRVTVSVYNRGVGPIEVTGVAVGLVPGDRGWQGETRDTVLPDSTDVFDGWLRSVNRSRPYWRSAPRGGDLFTVAPDGRAEDERPIGPEAQVTVRIAGAPVTLRVPVVHRFADQVLGDMSRPLAVAPAISVTLDRGIEYVRADDALRRTVQVTVRSAADSGPVRVSLRLPSGLRADSAWRTVTVPAGATRRLAFRVDGRLRPGRHAIRAVAERAGVAFSEGWTLIDYPHIRPRRLYEPAVLELEAIDVRVPASLTVGYINGVGDNSAPVLAQLGVPLTMIEPSQLPATDLSRFGAIVVGTRAYDANPELVRHNQQLLDYVRDGGTLVVQYGQYEMMRPGMMPYPITLGRPATRVTDEGAPVTILDPRAPLLNFPNRITARDFEGWVQDRSLYMPSGFDERYTPLLEMSDPGEPPNRGALLVARHGRGIYVYTTLAFFRQLPNGVPGAARLFVNLIAAGQASGTAAGEVP